MWDWLRCVAFGVRGDDGEVEDDDEPLPRFLRRFCGSVLALPQHQKIAFSVLVTSDGTRGAILIQYHLKGRGWG